MRTELIDNYSALQQRIRELRREEPATLVFRGQTQLRRGRLVPSLLRRGSEDYLRLYDSVWDKAVTRLVTTRMEDYLQWKRSVDGSLHQSTPSTGSQMPHGTMALLLREIFQHYGGRSPYLDVTSSVTIALWFAHHVFKMIELPLLPMDLNIDYSVSQFEPMPVYDAAWYEKAWNENHTTVGYLFVLAPNTRHDPGLPSRHGDFHDLLPNYWSKRIGRQQAGLIYSDGGIDAGDLGRRRFVRRIFRFGLPLDGAPQFVTTAATNWLFPPPDRDGALKDLLEAVPFRDDLEKPWTQKRLFPIPEYYASSPPEVIGTRAWNNYRATDRYVPRSFLFLKLAAQVGEALDVPLNGDLFSLRNALPMLAPYFVSTVLIPSDQVECPFPQNTKSIFLEYDQIEGVLSPEREDQESEFVLGAWIVQTRSGYWCRLFSQRAREPQIATSGHEFSFHRLAGAGDAGARAMRTNEAEYTELYWLSITLGLLADIASNRRRLSQVSFKPYLAISDNAGPGLSSSPF